MGAASSTSAVFAGRTFPSNTWEVGFVLYFTKMSLVLNPLPLSPVFQLINQISISLCDFSYGKPGPCALCGLYQ